MIASVFSVPPGKSPREAKVPDNSNIFHMFNNNTLILEQASNNLNS